jgi:hypothetical protein
MEFRAPFPWHVVYILPLWIGAYFAVVGLEFIRRKLPADTYKRVWGFLLVTSAMCAASALVQYCSRCLMWREELPFLPGLLLTVLLAKIRSRVSSGVYFWVVLLSLLLFFCILHIVNHSEPITKLFGPRRTQSNPFLGFIDQDMWDRLDWHRYWAPGICLFAAIATVAPPRLISLCTRSRSA